MYVFIIWLAHKKCIYCLYLLNHTTSWLGIFRTIRSKLSLLKLLSRATVFKFKIFHFLFQCPSNLSHKFCFSCCKESIIKQGNEVCKSRGVQKSLQVCGPCFDQQSTLEFMPRKIYSPGKFILSQLALHYMVKCNANFDWSDVSGEQFFLSLNSSSGNVVKLWAEL